MKNFVKLIKEVHEKRLSVVKKKLIDKKIPVATISMDPASGAEEAKSCRAQGFNVTTHLLIYPPPNLFLPTILTLKLS